MAVFSGFRPFLTKGSTVNGVQNIFFSDGTPGIHVIPNIENTYSSIYSGNISSYTGSIGLIEATNTISNISYGNIFLPENQGDVFIVSPSTCFTDVAGTIPAANGDLVRAIKGIVNNTLLTQSDDNSCPVLELDGRGYWSLRCNGVKFLSSSTNFTASGIFSAAISMSVLTLTGTSGLTHVIGPVAGTTTNGIFVRASATGGASQISGRIRISGGPQYDAMYASAFLTDVPFTSVVTSDNTTIKNRRGGLFYASISAALESATNAVPLRIGISSTYNARIYGGVFINRALTVTEASAIETRLRIDAGITPFNTATVGQITAAAQPLLGRAPRNVRNLLSDSENFNAWTKDGTTPAPTVESDTLIAPDGTLTADTLNFPLVNGLIRRAGPTFPLTAQPMTASIWLKAGTASSIRLNILRDSATISNFIIVNLTSEWQRFSVSATMTSATANPRLRLQALEVGTIGAWGAQLEFGSTASEYQKTVSARIEITEPNVLSYPFVRLDLSDDRLDTVLSDAVTGNIIIAGRSGSIVESISYAANSTFQLGPTTYTGGTPGILRAIGDIVGYSLIGRTINDLEKYQLIDYYKSRGAKGILVSGSELISNGDFSGGISEWSAGTFYNSIVSENNGKLRIQSQSDQNYAFASRTISGLTIGRAYQFSIDIEVISKSALLYLGFSGSSIAYSTNQPVPAGQNVITFVAQNTNLLIQPGVYLPDGDVYFDNVSLKELRPEEEW